MRKLSWHSEGMSHSGETSRCVLDVHVLILTNPSFFERVPTFFAACWFCPQLRSTNKDKEMGTKLGLGTCE